MIDLIKKYNVISIIGLEKNVGKTTTLNYIIEKTKGIIPLGLTSIGRDGETLDIVTGTGKPRIYVYRGTVLATARQSLRIMDITFEVICKTKINTPMGEIILVRALSDGYVEIAGPSITKELEQVTKEMMEANAKLVLIDGALSRKSLASPSVAKGTILSTGAAVSKSLKEVVKKTVHSYNLLNIEKVPNNIELLWNEGFLRAAIIDEDNEIQAMKRLDINTILEADNKFFSNFTESTKYIFLKGAITNKFIENLIKFKEGKKILYLVVEDGTKLFVSEENIRKIQLKNIVLLGKSKINVIAITINPTSPFGYSFDSEEFQSLLTRNIDVPVYNVKK